MDNAASESRRQALAAAARISSATCHVSEKNFLRVRTTTPHKYARALIWTYVLFLIIMSLSVLLREDVDAGAVDAVVCAALERLGASSALFCAPRRLDAAGAILWGNATQHDPRAVDGACVFEVLVRVAHTWVPVYVGEGSCLRLRLDPILTGNAHNQKTLAELGLPLGVRYMTLARASDAVAIKGALLGAFSYALNIVGDAHRGADKAWRLQMDRLVRVARAAAAAAARPVPTKTVSPSTSSHTVPEADVTAKGVVNTTRELFRRLEAGRGTSGRHLRFKAACVKWRKDGAPNLSTKIGKKLKQYFGLGVRRDQAVDGVLTLVWDA